MDRFMAGMVGSSVLRDELFTTKAMDNNRTATPTYHGTGISLFQYPTSDNKGETLKSENHLGPETAVKKVLNCLNLSLASDLLLLSARIHPHSKLTGW